MALNLIKMTTDIDHQAFLRALTGTSLLSWKPVRSKIMTVPRTLISKLTLHYHKENKFQKSILMKLTESYKHIVQRCSLLIRVQEQNFIKDIDRYSDLPNRNRRTQECNHFTENFTRELQIQTRSRRKGRKNSFTRNDSYRRTKFKNNDIKKIKLKCLPIQPQGDQYIHLGIFRREGERERAEKSIQRNKGWHPQIWERGYIYNPRTPTETQETGA